jgi:hypothetical protein
MVTAIVEEMQRDSDVVFYGQNMAMTERGPMLKKFGRHTMPRRLLLSQRKSRSKDFAI